MAHTCVLVAGDEDISILLQPFADYGGTGNNPNWRFDWFKVGGRFGHALKLRKPRQLRRFFGLLRAGTTLQAVVAKKSDIDQEALLANPPVALLFRDCWSESPLFAVGEAVVEWHQQFAKLFAQIPDEMTLTVVDCHS